MKKPPLKLYNTLKRRKEIFKPLKGKTVRFYACGPTVYDYPHIGNLRAYVAEDILRRTLELNGYRVKHVMNITDVGHLTSQADEGEDKVELAARKAKKTAWEIAEYFTKVFIDNLKTLNIKMPHIMPKATEHIKEMIELIKKLEKKGYTYRIDDGIYFDTSKLKDYGKLTGMNFKQLNRYLRAGARVPFNPQKRNITDFALWKFSPKDVKRQMEWPSPWGIGFPGWHIECSAMSMKYLGETFDIHAGGEDHIPIHHTNEIAQSEAATGKPFVRYWFHVAFLLVNGRKMSKSLGNYYTLQDLLNLGYDWREIRYALMAAHYRQQLNFTLKGLEAARNSVNRIIEFIRRLRDYEGGKHNSNFRKLIERYKYRFWRAINDDLNMPKALAVVFEFINKVNKLMDANRISKRNAKSAIKLMLWFDQILGLKLEEFLKERPLPKEAKELIEKRERARRKKDYKTADEIRKVLREKYGIILEDTKDGVRWKWAN